MALTESYFPADDSAVVLDTTVGSVLRTAATDAPDTIALVEGAEDADTRRTWTFADDPAKDRVGYGHAKDVTALEFLQERHGFYYSVPWTT